MKNLNKIIQIVTMATVLLGTAKISYGVELKLPCGAATILAGFKFKRDCQNGMDKYSIENTYDTRKSLTIYSNFVIKNGSSYPVIDNSISLIDFMPRKTLLFNGTKTTKSTNFRFSINGRNLALLKKPKSLSISCKNGTKRIGDIVITPTCSGKNPSFFVEHNGKRGSTYWVSYQGASKNFKIKNFKALSSGEQHKFDLSIISNPGNSNSQVYTFIIYEPPYTAF